VKEIAAIGIGDRERRIVFDGGVEIGQRAVEVALVEEGIAAVVVGQRESRIEPDRLVVIGNRAIKLAFEGVDAAAVGKGASRAGIEPDRFVDIGKRAVEFTLFGQAVAAEAISRRKPLAGLLPGIDHGAARHHPLIRRGGRADAGLPALIAFGGCRPR
jgi:hypothetical protein